jgi:hypothetical protein
MILGSDMTKPRSGADCVGPISSESFIGNLSCNTGDKKGELTVNSRFLRLDGHFGIEIHRKSGVRIDCFESGLVRKP